MFNSNLCVICKYSLVDPVCVGCYTKQTLILLNDLKVSFIINDFVHNRLKKALSLETLDDVVCVLCKKDNVIMCRYCFSVILIRVLRELNFSEDLIKNFEYNSMYEKISLENKSMLDNEDLYSNYDLIEN